MSEINKNGINKIENLYDKYIMGTSKLWKNSDGKDIQDIKDDKGNIIGRKFISKNKVLYYEIFEDERFNILGLSSQITFLFIPKEENNDLYCNNNCIGFRYYENSKNLKCRYFTLIKKYNNRYYILEKNDKIKDKDGDLFYNKDLDCYSIIRKIVYEKYKNGNSKRTPNGELFPEIIGYTYAIISLMKFKNFIVVEPFIPNRIEKESLIEKIPENLEKNIVYIEPIFYNNHVSVLLVTAKEEKNYLLRENYLIDISTYHSKKNIFNPILFSKEMINRIKSYPDESIQKNNSCGLWFYGIIDLLYSNNEYLTFQNILDSLIDHNDKFYFDVINLLSTKLYNLANIIDNKDIYEDVDNADLKRVYTNYCGKSYSFSCECLTNYFFSLSDKFRYIDKNDSEIYGLDLLFRYEKLIEKIKNYKRKVEFNNEYLKYLSDEGEYNQNIKNKFENHLKNIKNFLRIVNINFIQEFNNVIYDIINECIFEIEVVEKKKCDNLKNKLESLVKKKAKNIFKLESEFTYLESDLQSIHILDELVLIQNINPNNEFLFQLMNK